MAVFFWISRRQSRRKATTRSRPRPRVIPARARRPSRRRSPHTPRSSPFALTQPAPRALETDTRGRTRSPPAHRPSDIGDVSSFPNFMSSHASMSLPAPTRVGAAARAARRVALARYVSVTPSLLVRRARTRARPRPAVAVPDESRNRVQKLRRRQVYKWQARKRFLPKSSNRRFFFPVRERSTYPLIPPSPPPELAGRARPWLPPRGPCAPRSPRRRRPRAARSSRTSPSLPIPAAGTARWGTT